MMCFASDLAESAAVPRRRVGFTRTAFLSAWIGAFAQAGCGRAAPTVPSGPQLPQSGLLSITGTVVGNPGRSPIPGASVTLGASSVTTDSAGRFSFTPQANPSSSTPVRVAAPGYIARESFLPLDTSRTDLAIDIVTDAPPFSIDFYRQFARNARDNPTSLSRLNPWTVAPSFYIKTTLDDTSEEIPAAIIDRIRMIFVNSVPELSGGRFNVVAIETGPDPRPARPGWVNVLFQRVLSDPTAGGQATIGGNQGTIWLRYYPSGVTPSGGVPRRECEFLSVSAAEHEVVHTMGYFHTSDIFSHFFTASCTGANRASIVRHHASIVYSRPPGNADPDSDPSTFVLGLVAGTPTRPVVVSCPSDLVLPFRIRR